MMNSLILYTVQVSLVFIVLYLFYRIVLSRFTFHNLNRTFLLLMLPMALSVPLIDIGWEWSSQYFIPKETLTVLFDDFIAIEGETTQALQTAETSWTWGALIFSCYLIGVVFYFIKIALSISVILRIRQRYSYYAEGVFKVFQSDKASTFSFFKWIFVPENKHTNQAIILHEKLHGKAWHSLDLILTELFIAFQWFNPFVYLYRRDLKTVHEFQVDSMMLKSDIKKSDYLQLMLSHLIKSHKQVNLYNYFNGFTIKKRVKMITRDKSSSWKLLSYLLIIPITTVLLMSFSYQQLIEDVNGVASVKKDGEVPSISPIKKSDYKRITSHFGMKIHPIEKVKKMHKGMDFSAKIGTKVLATAGGIVTRVEYLKDTYGKLVIINHGGDYETLYCHLNDFNVKEGQKVKVGDVIAYVGNTGASTGPHLHYEVRKSGKSVDPKEYIK